MYDHDLNIEDLEEGMMNGYFDVECPECGEEIRIEPDGSGPCPECGQAHVSSPLIERGLI